MDRAQYFHVPFYRRSSILEGICFLVRLYEYTKIKSPDSGKITSLPRSQDVKRGQLCASLQSSPKINYVLITSRIYIQCKSSRFFAVSTVSARNAWEPNLPFVLNGKKKSGLQIMTLGAEQPRVLKQSRKYKQAITKNSGLVYHLLALWNLLEGLSPFMHHK